MSDNKFRPQKIDDETISISNYYIPIKQIGCNLDACRIIKYWEHLEKKGFPLAQIPSLLVALEYIYWTKKNMISLLPFPMYIISMVDAIYYAESIKEGKQRINYLKKGLCSLISKSINFPNQQQNTRSEILKKIITCQFLLFFRGLYDC